MAQFDQITFTPGGMGGRECFWGVRITAGMVVGEIGAGTSIEQLLSDFPDLEREDVLQTLRYAAWRISEREIPLEAAGSSCST